MMNHSGLHRASYYVLRPWEIVRERWNNLHDFWQRGRRGWSNSDTWNMDCYLALVIPQMLRYLAATDQGCPPGFGSGVTSLKEINRLEIESDHNAWHAYLREIASAFEEYTRIRNGDYEELNEYRNESYTAVLEKMRRIFEYYTHLWS